MRTSKVSADRGRMKKGAHAQSAMGEEQFHRISRVISDRTRYDILRKVFAGEGVTCGCAAEGLSISAATTSHHIRELSLSGLIDVTKHGRYRIVGPRRRVWKAYLVLLGRL